MAAAPGGRAWAAGPLGGRVGGGAGGGGGGGGGRGREEEGRGRHITARAHLKGSPVTGADGANEPDRSKRRTPVILGGALPPPHTHTPRSALSWRQTQRRRRRRWNSRTPSADHEEAGSVFRPPPLFYSRATKSGQRFPTGRGKALDARLLKEPRCVVNG